MRQEGVLQGDRCRGGACEEGVLQEGRCREGTCEEGVLQEVAYEEVRSLGLRSMGASVPKADALFFRPVFLL